MSSIKIFKIAALAFFIVLFVNPIVGQNKRPKLVVGIVVDQMRADYINKYWDKFGEEGFKKLVKDGYKCNNVHYNYIPTYTGPGHASIYTGTTPAFHGIIANDWYDKFTADTMYCAQDESVTTLGANNSSGKMSPRNLKTSTITDELKLYTNGKSKVIGISLKDRGAILPAGHSADAAYWLDGKSGNWVSSTHYMQSLPGWVSGINAAKPCDAFLQQVWEPLLPLNQYSESRSDDNDYERPFPGEERPVFPHDLTKSFEKKGYGVLKASPHGNTLTRMLAVSAIENEYLGKDYNTDFLAISFSATDYVGHQFGPESIELADTYIRLDKEIEELLKVLNLRVGSGNFTVFLTADHGAVRVPQFLIDNKQEGGYFNADSIDKKLNEELSKHLGEGKWVSNYSNGQFFLNQPLIIEKNIYLDKLFQVAEAFLIQMEGVAAVYNRNEIKSGTNSNSMINKLQLGFNPKSSGDILLVLQSGWIHKSSYGNKGTTHGSGYAYDTHVPLLLYGNGVNKGQSNRYIEITDIAVTLSMLLDIPIPSGSIGKPILEAIQ